ncbi:hypothetical protein [Halobacillus aidingensis]|uniref:Uncharacterized protein n=1 Tax=Halobacillus aidingensis TaxID=240303 RepID=A0A1H0MEV2_HALAD|nr:hypothetical protein [Halobacillus aidingensis]SDO78776.1 hypothetical protein SAMN05421677_10810 [Halobacillus aidingensis]
MGIGMPLTSIEGNIMTSLCSKCGNETTTDISNDVVGKDEFGFWKGYRVKCQTEGCPRIMFYNLNLPLDAEDEPFESGDLPLEEEVQRYYVRLLIRTVREDFVSKEGG